MAPKEEDEEIKEVDSKTSEEYQQLEKDINRIMMQKKQPSPPMTEQQQPSSSDTSSKEIMQRRLSSRASSFDSTVNPGSPFQNNPLLVSHDYSKSPLMLEEDSNSSMASSNNAAKQKVECQVGHYKAILLFFVI